MPMIPLGLKETKEISFMEPFSDFILEHYSEEPSMYMDAIADITDTRQVRTEADCCQFCLLIFFSYSIYCRPPKHPHVMPRAFLYSFATTIFCTMLREDSFLQIGIWVSTLSGMIR